MFKPLPNILPKVPATFSLLSCIACFCMRIDITRAKNTIWEQFIALLSYDTWTGHSTLMYLCIYDITQILVLETSWTYCQYHWTWLSKKTWWTRGRDGDVLNIAWVGWGAGERDFKGLWAPTWNEAGCWWVPSADEITGGSRTLVIDGFLWVMMEAMGVREMRKGKVEEPGVRLWSNKNIRWKRVANETEMGSWDGWYFSKQIKLQCLFHI